MLVALVTTTPEEIGTFDLDMAELIGALGRAGIRAEAPVWHDVSVDWDGYDLVIIRSPWDYSRRPADFLEWLDRVSAGSPNRVRNCAHTIRWNLNKRYLEQLQGQGVPIVPSSFASTVSQARHAIDGIVGDVVVKPTISAGAKDTGMFGSDDPGALALAESIIVGGREVIIQRAIASVAERGETALLYFNGVFSHALIKGPILARGGTLLGGEYTETVQPAEPTTAQFEVAQRTLAAAKDLIRTSGSCDCRSTTPLYARFDLVDSEQGPLLLEAELFEPSYFVETSPGASDRFAQAVSQQPIG